MASNPTTEPYDPSKPVYSAFGRLLSISDLLRRFSDLCYQERGICRLSDLHLKVGAPARYRLDGELIPVEGGAPVSAKQLEQLLFPLLTREQVSRLKGEEPLDVDAGYELPSEVLNFRINAFHDREGLACSIRVVPRSIPPVERIGFPSERTWREIVGLSQGLVLLTGITGSGKSTTVASLLQHINQNQRVRIITLEDPVEYVIESQTSLISQRELGKHILSFSEALRSALREDPDIIFVGEMRDQETTSLALSAAETGHLVLSTLHTKDTKGAISRIVDMFPPDRFKELCTQLSFSLSYVIAQRLLPAAGGTGLRVVMEVLKNIPSVANLIRTGNWQQLYSAMEIQGRQGMNTFDHHLSALVDSGEIARKIAMRHASDPGRFADD